MYFLRPVQRLLMATRQCFLTVFGTTPSEEHLKFMGVLSFTPVVGTFGQMQNKQKIIRLDSFSPINRRLLHIVLQRGPIFGRWPLEQAGERSADRQPVEMTRRGVQGLVMA